MPSEIIKKADTFITATYKRLPVVLTRGERCTLWDESGRAYLDFVAGIAVCNLGHAHPRISEAVARQADLAHLYRRYGETIPDVLAWAEQAADAHGKVNVIINNAGIMVPHAPVLDMPIEHIEQIFAVNFYGVVYGSKVFGKRFIEQGTPAAIYNLGSENSLFHGTPLNGAYVATKQSVFAITQSLQEEMPDFIEVSLICPQDQRIQPVESLEC